MFVYRTTFISPYSKEDFTREVRKLPPPFLEYAWAAKEGEARARRLAALRALADLLERTGMKPAPIVVGTYGKPDFRTCGYHFSLSHTDGVAAAVLSDRVVGIDIESYDHELPKDRMERLMRRFFPEEQALIREASSPSRMFIEIWAKKEAMVKHSGRGLADLYRANTTRHEPRLLKRMGRWPGIERNIVVIY